MHKTMACEHALKKILVTSGCQSQAGRRALHPACGLQQLLTTLAYLYHLA